MHICLAEQEKSSNGSQVFESRSQGNYLEQLKATCLQWYQLAHCGGPYHADNTTVERGRNSSVGSALGSLSCMMQRHGIDLLSLW